MSTCSTILSWRIPWTKEPGGLHSMGSYRVRHDLELSALIHPTKFSTKLIYFSDNEKCSESQGKRPSQLTKERLHWLLTRQEQHTKQIKEWSKETHTQVFLT